jgi:hypothetical protein
LDAADGVIDGQHFGQLVGVARPRSYAAPAPITTYAHHAPAPAPVTTYSGRPYHGPGHYTSGPSVPHGEPSHYHGKEVVSVEYIDSSTGMRMAGPPGSGGPDPHVGQQVGKGTVVSVEYIDKSSGHRLPGPPAAHHGPTHHEPIVHSSPAYPGYHRVTAPETYAAPATNTFLVEQPSRTIAYL